MGFTLIELMVTVAIVAILAAIAYPSYRNYVIRGQLVNATNGLAALQANMERFYQDNRTYVTVVGTTTFTSPCTVAPASGPFTLSCTGAGAPSLTAYILTATGSGNTAGFVFTVDNLNTQQTVVSTPAPSSWIGTFPCWITKQGGC
jgi:prepilin-type N-terminal cleavage/methylation domain-containing protein